MVRKDVLLAPLGSRVRSLDVDNNVAPGDLRPHRIVSRKASHRPLHWLRAHLLARLASVQPAGHVGRHVLRVAQAPHDLERLAARPVEIHEDQT